MSARRTGSLFYSDKTNKFHPPRLSTTHPRAFLQATPASHLRQFRQQSDAPESACRAAGEVPDREYANPFDTLRTPARAATPGPPLPSAWQHLQRAMCEEQLNPRNERLQLSFATLSDRSPQV